jgi:hypothetical protein
MIKSFLYTSLKVFTAAAFRQFSGVTMVNNLLIELYKLCITRFIQNWQDKGDWGFSNYLALVF